MTHHQPDTTAIPEPAEIAQWLTESGAVPLLQATAAADVLFLARGEYSVNYRVSLGHGDWVVRLVTGSQMGLGLADQVAYEYAALERIAASGVTPRPLAVVPRPAGLAWPLIVEGFLPGGPLDYRRDLTAAADAIARVHAVPVSEPGPLEVHPDPVPRIADEAEAWLAPYRAWSGADAAALQCLDSAAAEVRERLAALSGLFADCPLVMVNYDLNTHNFCVDDERAGICDWEKARLAPAVIDLGHFLLPTTTLWREATAARLSAAEEIRFLNAYMSSAGVAERSRFLAQFHLARQAVALRAVSWCAWALQAAVREGRAGGNSETLERARFYLRADFLQQMFGQIGLERV